jgi:hypothetical protein
MMMSHSPKIIVNCTESSHISVASENYLTRGATIGVQHIIIPPPQKKDREVETHKLYRFI